MQTTLRTALLSCVGICLAGTTYAADLIIDTPIISPTPIAYNWDGFYLGGQVGFGTAFADHTSVVPGNDLTLSGGLIGLKMGFNAHLADQVVGGIEGDINWANITGQDTSLFGAPTHTINWLGSFRGRLGYDAGQFLPYLTGGVAFAQATRESTFGAPPANTATAMHFGWTAGAGIEFAATEQVSVDIQYRYSDLGSQVYDWSGPGTNPTIRLTANTITAGINWHF